jgi:hypothetical protein
MPAEVRGKQSAGVLEVRDLRGHVFWVGLGVLLVG